MKFNYEAGGSRIKIVENRIRQASGVFGFFLIFSPKSHKIEGLLKFCDLYNRDGEMLDGVAERFIEWVK